MVIAPKPRASKKVANITQRARFALWHARRAQQKEKTALQQAKESSHPEIQEKWLLAHARAQKAKFRLVKAAQQSLRKANPSGFKPKKKK